MSMTQPTRRDVLRLGGAAAASVLLAPVARARAAAWKKIPIGTQLWCVRKQLATDIPGTLNAIGALGYEAVELENAFGKSGAEWRTLSRCRQAAGRAASTIALSELQGDKLAASVEFNQAIGNRNLIIRSLAPPVYTSADLLKKTADEVNEVAGEAEAARTARRVPQPHDGLQSHRRRVLVEPLRRSDREETSCCSSTPATRRRRKA